MKDKPALFGFMISPVLVFDLAFAAFAVLYESVIRPLFLNVALGRELTTGQNIPLGLLALAASFLEIYGIRAVVLSIRQSHEPPGVKRILAVMLLTMWGRVCTTGILALVCVSLFTGMGFVQDYQYWPQWVIWLVFIFTVAKEGAVFYAVVSLRDPYKASARTAFPSRATPRVTALGHFFILLYACVAFTAVWELAVVKWILNGVAINIAAPLEFFLMAIGALAGSFLFIVPIRLGYLLQGFEPGMDRKDRALHWAAFALALLAVFLPITRAYNAADYNARGEKRLAGAEYESDIIEAARDFSMAIRLDPGAPCYYINRGLCWLLAGSNGQAYSDFTNAKSREAAASILHCAMADWLFLEGREDESAAEYSRACRSGLTNAEYYYRQARLFYNLEKFPAAARLAFIAVLNNPSSAAYRNFLGNCYYSSGKKRLALVYYARAIELDRSNGGYYYDRGWCYLDLDAYGKAEEYFGNAIRLDPENGRFYDGRGLARYYAKKYGAAMLDWRKGASLNDKKSREHLWEYFREKTDD